MLKTALQPSLPSIVFFIPTLLVGGAERHTVDLCERLRRRGLKCRIVVHGSLKSEVITKMDGADNAVFLDLRGMSDIGGWVKTWRVLNNLKPDIVVAINQSPFIVAVLLRLFLWKKFKLFPFTIKSVYTILLAATCYAICYFAFGNLHGLTGLVLRSLAFILLYGGSIIWFRLSPDIYPVIETIRKKISGKRERK